MIVETERDLPHKHLIAQNIANEKARIERPNPAVSIFNFHYATPPATVGMNYGLGKVIGDDETGFRGVDDRPYRIEAWDFLIAGGCALRPPRLLVHDGPRGRHGPGRRAHARRRRPGVLRPVADLEAVHRGLRLRADGPGPEGHRPRHARIDLGPGASPNRPRLMRSTPTAASDVTLALELPARPIPGRVAEPCARGRSRRRRRSMVAGAASMSPRPVTRRTWCCGSVGVDPP